jgi:zinc ribbon protein
MSGLIRRIRRTRAAAAEESRTESPAPSEPQDATPTAERPGGGSLLVDPATPRPTTVPPTPLAEMRDLPAGLEVEELRSPRPATERRSRLRHRTRYLRRVRELLLRDLGGLVYEIHRSTGGDRAHHDSLVRAKAERLTALDAELFALEKRIGAEHPETVLREPGIGGSCPSCGELHSSDARFCSACGTPLTGRAPVEQPRAEEPAAAEDAPTVVQPPTESPTAEGPRGSEESRTAEEPRAEESPAAEESRAEESRTAEEPREEPRTEDPSAPEDPRAERQSRNGREAASPDLATPVERKS